uniref:Exonuclease 3'-5' domain-containing protein 2 n=1 Tax=Glossina pallidipes TaxID=7398 RepID=A0A1A9ZM47_GLOPL
MSNVKPNSLSNSLTPAKSALLAGAGIGLLFMVVKRQHLLSYWNRFQNPLKRKHVVLIQNTNDCQKVVNILKSHCSDYKVLGFDCEWVTVSGSRRPVALLQLCSNRGYCALFRLCCIRQIPKSLRDLLADEEVIKVGVDPGYDAQKLAQDYGVGVASTFDLRYLATMVGRKPEGLAKLSLSVLKVTLDKHWRLSCSNWEAKDLTEKQIEYAANDAFVAVEIFKILAREFKPRFSWLSDFAIIKCRIEPFLEVPFNSSVAQKRSKATLNKSVTPNKTQNRNLSTLSKALYDNCLLQAPDGELLCTIDKRKAEWYLQQQLGVKIESEPFTVRLNFEPASRAIGEVGRYYQTPKENRCVVCGERNAFVRKNIVPREYRKHFPVVLKSHTSHDVLLLCPKCHQISNISDYKVRNKLSEMCDAPCNYHQKVPKPAELPELRQVKMAARALLNHAEQIPLERRKYLETLILNHFKESEDINWDMIREASELHTREPNENCCTHGEKVVQKFQTDFGGLKELEKLWRQHFLNTMEPKYLPPLWDVNHNANRLEIRATQGRVTEEDMLIAGVPLQKD